MRISKEMTAKSKIVGKLFWGVVTIMTTIILMPHSVFADTVHTSVEVPSGYENDESCGTIYIDGVAYDTMKGEFEEGYVSFDFPEGSNFATMYKMTLNNGIWIPRAMTVWDISHVKNIDEEFSGDVDDLTGEDFENAFDEGNVPDGQADQGDENQDGQENQDGDSPDGQADQDDENQDGQENQDGDSPDGQADQGDENQNGIDNPEDIPINPNEDEENNIENDENEAPAKPNKPILISEFDDLFLYKGFSIRIKGDSGIRAKTGIKTNAKSKLLSDEGLAGYKLIEYGQIAKSKEKLENDFNGNLVIGDGISGARCYYQKNGKTIDSYLSDSNDSYVIFANCLKVPASNFTTEVCYRAYAKLKRIEDDSDVIVYGPVVTKSIYEVAVARSKASDIDNNATEKDYVGMVRGTVELKDGTIVFLGDSIMKGEIGIGVTVDTPFSTFLKRKIQNRYNDIDINVEKISEGGGSWCIPGCNGYTKSMMGMSENIVTEDPKIIMILAGNNDWHYQVQHQGTNRDPRTGHGKGPEDCSGVFGEIDSDGLIKYANGASFDPLTQKFQETENYNRAKDLSYCSSIFMTLKSLTDKYPDAKIVVLTPPQARYRDNGVGTEYRGSVHRNGKTEKNLPEYAEALEKVAGYYGKVLKKNVYVIDIYNDWNEGKEDSASFYSYFINDGVHLNQNGHEAISNFIFKKLYKDVIEK